MSSGAPLRSYVDGDAWICVFCETRNPLAADPCGNCGLSFDGGRLADNSPGRELPAFLTSAGHPLAELAVAVTLFLLWKLGDVAAGAHPSGAIGRGRAVWNAERDLRLPSEAALQRQFLPHVDVLHGLDGYYAIAHVGGMLALAVWLFVRHRSSYARWRNAVVVTTASCFAIQFIPVAPPRLVSGLDVVDTARRYGESVYGSAHFANQLSSMPSVHQAWALLVAAAVVTVGATWKRWLVIAHPVLTLLAIVVTGNHYWLDAIAAAAITAGATGLVMTANARLEKQRLAHE